MCLSICIIQIVTRWTGAGYPAVMGTGIVSVAFAADGHDLISRGLLAVAAILYVALVRHFRATPAAVAATGVLGARATQLGWDSVALVLLGLAVAIWVLQLRDARELLRLVTGSSFMPAVATESIAVLAALQHRPALVAASLVPWALGLLLYARAASRFELRQLAHGGGDHWIAGGALAISTLATAWIARDSHALHSTFAPAALVLWAVAMAWLVVLVVAEIRNPRLRHDVRRWSTVFPVGMYAACSFATARAAGVHAIGDFASGWAWVALGTWLVVAARQSGPRPARSTQ
jgi:hypothetical protein